MKNALSFLLSSGISFCLAQNDWNRPSEDQRTQLIEESIEFIEQEQLDQGLDYTSLFEHLDSYLDHPLSLNHTDENELRTFGLLNELQIRNLLSHREKHGKFLAFEELQSVVGFDLHSLKAIRPFFKLISHEKLPMPGLLNLLHEGRSSWFIRFQQIIEPKKGYSNGSQDGEDAAYSGSPFQLMNRYRFRYGRRLSLGVSAEKDAGEEFFKGSQKSGFDFYSAHLFLSDQGKLKQLALGDFQAQFGQGLTFWSGLAFNRGSGIGSLKRQARGLSPYTAVQENNFLRGAGICIQHKMVKWTAFISKKQLDANRSDDDPQKRVTSFPGNGYHRTQSELEKKDQLPEFISGINVQYRKRSFHIGVSLAIRELGSAIEKNQTIYRQFQSPEKSQLTKGIDYQFNISNFLFFGEFARSNSGGTALIHGLLWAAHKRLSIGFMQRHYHRNYLSIQSNGIGVSSGNNNESGSRISLESSLSRAFKLMVQIDLYRKNWLSFQADAPSQGSSYILQLNNYPGKGVEVYIRLRGRKREKNKRNDKIGLPEILPEIQKSLRFHLNYEINEILRYQFRIEFSRYIQGIEEEKGMIMYQDLKFKKPGSIFSMSARYQFFDTESYSTRIYAYENDLLYAFSIPANYGKGNRWYILSQWKLKKGVDLWIRYSQTAYLDRNFIGDGNERIEGPLKSEIKAQLRFKF